jgi:hypothetical protein
VPLVELRLTEIKVAVGIRWIEPDHRLQVAARDVPLVFLGGDQAQDHMPVNRARIGVDNTLSQRAGASEIGLAERFVGLLQQGGSLGRQEGGDRDCEKKADHVTSTSIVCR